MSTAARRGFASEDRDWMVLAACRGQDSDYWFPQRRVDARYGKRICAGCPVQRVCLEQSLIRRELFGTFGGVDEWQRADMLGRKCR